MKSKNENANFEVATDYTVPSMTVKHQRIFRPGRLSTVTMEELLETIYPYTPPIVEEMLGTGLYLLAGAPKCGKSFLAAQLCYYVSQGLPLWGHKVYQCTVLYLALEDTEKRLQLRLSRMFGVQTPGDIHFCTVSNQVGNGLEVQLENFLREYPDNRTGRDRYAGAGAGAKCRCFQLCRRL